MKKKSAGLLVALLAALCLLPAGALAAEPEEGEAVREFTVESAVFQDAEADEDNDELFSAYILRRFYGDAGISPLSANDRARDRLGEGTREWTVYGVLLSKIQDVAKRGGDTHFAIPLKDLGMKVQWSAQELRDKGLLTSDNDVQSVVNALCASEYPLDSSSVLNALLADCPYELYWFDKTAGAATGYGGSYSYSSSSTNGSLESLDLTERNLLFYMSVSKDYQDQTVQGEDRAYTVTSDVSEVDGAVNNAKAIVGKYQTQSDYLKLQGYKAEICDLVSYNSEAAGNKSTPYGNPWQLIWVFDGKTSTNVVCEGYAKAFQLLCDLSSFSGRVDCYTVDGIMSGGTGAGNHMWNIVRINGKGYLVDVTNSDAGTVGQDGGLFLAGTRERDTSEPYRSYVFTIPGIPGVSEPVKITYNYNEYQPTLWGPDVLTLAEAKYDPDAPAVTETVIESAAKTADGKFSVSAAVSGPARLLAAAYGEGGKFLSLIGYKDITEAGYYSLASNVPGNAVSFKAMAAGSGTWSPLCGAK